jgi:hypothetical protein
MGPDLVSIPSGTGRGAGGIGLHYKAGTGVGLIWTDRCGYKGTSTIRSNWPMICGAGLGRTGPPAAPPAGYNAAVTAFVSV